jgi:hypothetical protein
MLATRTLSTHNVEINTRILIKRKGNCGSGNDRPKVIRYRQKSIVFRKRRLALRLASSNHGRVGVTAKSKKGRVFLMPLSEKSRYSSVCSDSFPIGPMHRHPREITAISALDSRVEAVS